ncbi:MAG TPA: hypothetical protein VNO55_02950, partial [Polyangia bacterium]|nr:hypothetical protein [Polyangia bacterium]
HYAAAGYPGLNAAKFHTETIVRLPYFEGDPNLDGSVFMASWSDPVVPRMGVAKLGFKTGYSGKMLGTNRSYMGVSSGYGDWLVAPNPADTFLPSGDPNTIPGVNLGLPGSLFENGMNHPGGSSALGAHVIVPLQGWVYGCVIFGTLACGNTPDDSQPIVQIWDMANPSAPTIRSSLLSHVNGNGTANVGSAITKLSDGRFLLAVYKDTPTAQMEFYLSNGTDLDDPNLFAGNLDPNCPGTCGRLPDAVWENGPDWQNFNIITDCDGTLFLLGMRGDADPGNQDIIENYELGIASAGQTYGCGFASLILNPIPTNYCVWTQPVGTSPPLAILSEYGHSAPAGSQTSLETPVGQKHMYCSDNDNTDQCDFSAAAGAYVDPNGKVILYSTDYDGDGGFSSDGVLVHGNGAPWFQQPPFPGYPGFIRGIEFHERHGNFGGSTACPTLADAWVEFYENPNFNNEGADGGQTFRVSYPERSERSAVLGTNSFNDKASSIRWCLPAGASFKVFRDNWSGSSAVLNGSGKVVGVTNLATISYPSGGGNMNDSISTFVFQENVTDSQGISSATDDGD